MALAVAKGWRNVLSTDLILWNSNASFAAGYFPFGDRCVAAVIPHILLSAWRLGFVGERLISAMIVTRNRARPKRASSIDFINSCMRAQVVTHAFQNVETQTQRTSEVRGGLCVSEWREAPVERRRVRFFVRHGVHDRVVTRA